MVIQNESLFYLITRKLESILVIRMSQDASMLALGTRNGVIKTIDIKSRQIHHDFGSSKQGN